MKCQTLDNVQCKTLTSDIKSSYIWQLCWVCFCSWFEKCLFFPFWKCIVLFKVQFFLQWHIDRCLKNGVSKSMPIFSFIGYTLTDLFRKSGNWWQIYKQTSLTFNKDILTISWFSRFLSLFLCHNWFSLEFVLKYNISLMLWEISSQL